MDLQLTGKVALVTGASRGIGRAIAEGLAARGAEALGETQRALEAEVLAVPADVGDDASVEALVEKARERFGKIDILISNASALAVSGDRASWDASGPSG